MPHFVLFCLDGDRAVDLRPLHREAHLAHVRGSGMTRIAGPLVDEAGSPVGSMLIVEAEDLAAAKAICAADPYNREGVFRSVEVLPFRMTYIDLPSN